MPNGPDRDYDSDAYRKWRKGVFARDRFKCQMPGCPGRNRRLNAHHIRRWASYPELRFIISNGITLCHGCHEKVTGNEEQFEPVFLKAVAMKGDSDIRLRLMLGRLGPAPKDKDEENDQEKDT